MTFIFNLLAKIIIILALVFTALTLIFIIWHYSNILIEMIEEKIKEVEDEQHNK